MINKVKENKKFGKEIAEVADKVILVGEEITKDIYDGLIENNFDKKNIYIGRCKRKL